ncbi:hypothetical protein [Streptomyces sp. SM14]|uniref:hypothetical protein n=1 Tax=Streptomyces sp. SM14 TaxID=1736045 RepID=UPI000CD58331|nr:hypothetical protein [Streptomyces sp. SM14]
MPAFRRDDADRGRPAAVPRLASALTLTFTRDDRGTEPADMWAYKDHWRDLAGAELDFAWLESAPAVSYHDMAEAVGRALGPETLAGIDLVVVAMTVADCRHASMAGALLGGLTDNDALVLGVSEQGAAAPFTALRIATGQLAAGSRDRALVVVMEQSTLPPCPVAGVRPTRDAAVAMILETGPGPGARVGTPQITVTSRGADPDPAAAAPPAEPASPVRTLIAGPGLDGLAPADGVRLLTAEPGLPGAGVWATLARHLNTGEVDGDILVADRDPHLPYHCALHLTEVPAGTPPVPAATARNTPKELVP